MSSLVLTEATLSASAMSSGQPLVLTIRFSVEGAIAFDIDVSVDIFDANGMQLTHSQMRSEGSQTHWLPRGTYRARALTAESDLVPGHYTAHIALWHRDEGTERKAGSVALPFEVKSGAGKGPRWAWQLDGESGTSIDALPWKRGPEDWFYKHFDHAATTIITYLLGDSPLLKGRILDVGCGDGITDLGIAMRVKPTEFIGVDPFRGFDRLPGILSERNLPGDWIPPNLKFMAVDANALPFPDDSFDVVLSWGSMEHIAGGYAQSLDEIQRVLRPDGLLMIAPGLFFSDIGNHLGEFRFAREEPYVHLKRPREWIREQVLKGDIQYIDRCGDDAPPESYWQWFTELNPITVPDFEQELRRRNFEPWRIALRTQERVDYTPELQKYSFIDLACCELYTSVYNRKHLK
jgi:SAM-dependent methyltransferase